MADAAVEPIVNPEVVVDPKAVTGQLVIEPKPVVAEEPAKVEPEEPAVVEYNETGDVGLDMALAFVGKLGIGPDHPAFKAATLGDFDLLSATLAGLGDKAKGWEQFIKLAQKSYQDNAAKDKAAAATIQAAVFEVAGGQQEWVAVQAWAKKEADPAEKEGINAMLTAGPLQARAAAALLVQEYQKRAMKAPASATNKTGASTNGPADNGGPINRREAVVLTNQLVQKLGTSANLNQQPEYQAIWSRVR